MNDDDLRSAFANMADSVESSVRRPPGRHILQRAGLVARPAKPFPLAGVIGFAAVPFVAVGALLVYPAGAKVILGGDSPDPVPTVSSGSFVDVQQPGDAVPTVPAPTTTTPPDTGSQAIKELAKVVVVFSDDRVAGDPCRRLTEAERLVPPADPVQGAVDALLAGPQPDEAAVGLASPLAGTSVTADVDTATSVVSIVVTDPATLPGDCAVSEFAAALGETVGAFEGWNATLEVAGTPVDVPMPDDLAVPDGGNAADASAEPSGDVSAEATAPDASAAATS